MCIVPMHKCLQVSLFIPGLSAAPIGTLTMALWGDTRAFMVALIKNYTLSIFLELSIYVLSCHSLSRSTRLTVT